MLHIRTYYLQSRVVRKVKDVSCAMYEHWRVAFANALDVVQSQGAEVCSEGGVFQCKMLPLLVFLLLRFICTFL